MSDTPDLPGITLTDATTIELTDEEWQPLVNAMLAHQARLDRRDYSNYQRELTSVHLSRQPDEHGWVNLAITIGEQRVEGSHEASTILTKIINVRPGGTAARLVSQRDADQPLLDALPETLTEKIIAELQLRPSEITLQGPVNNNIHPGSLLPEKGSLHVRRLSNTSVLITVYRYSASDQAMDPVCTIDVHKGGHANVTVPTADGPVTVEAHLTAASLERVSQFSGVNLLASGRPAHDGQHCTALHSIVTAEGSNRTGARRQQ